MTVSGNDYDCVETCISKKIDIYEEFMINYKLDYQNTIKITEEREVIYTISSKHRGNNKNKSNWSIKMHIEVSLFKSALKKGYEDGMVSKPGYEFTSCSGFVFPSLPVLYHVAGLVYNQAEHEGKDQ